MKLLTFLFVTLLHLKMLAQIDYKEEVTITTDSLKTDTPYYTDLSDQLLVKLTTNFKYTSLRFLINPPKWLNFTLMAILI